MAPRLQNLSANEITRRTLLGAAAAVFALPRSPSAAEQVSHAVAMHGEPLHPPHFSHFPYANPQAPIGGRLRLGIQGAFDSLNPLIFRGEAASGLREYVYESLLARSADEPFTLYGHIAQWIELPAHRRWIRFRLNPKARFSDGTPITTEDIAFSHALLRDRGWPFMRTAYSRVAQVAVMESGAIRFDFAGDGDRELPLLLGLMPIVSKARIDEESFEQTTLIPPVGSGPYVVERLEAGRTIVYRRDPTWWARDLPQARGRHNFETIRIEYFRDGNALFEAFKAGDIDVYSEGDPTRWARGYDFPAVRDGRVMRRELPLAMPAPMVGLVFNTRRQVFADKKVRRALNLAFDAEWFNASLYAAQLRRTQSFFERSELSAHARPASERERQLLAPFPEHVEPDVLAGTYRQPISPGTGRNRANLRLALDLLHEAGYVLSGQQLVSAATGRPFRFEVLLNSRRQERLLLAYGKALALLGITMTLRQADSAQYELRLKTTDFDMIQTQWQSSLSPGNEQRNRFGSASAGVENTRNYAGVRDAAADAMIEAMVAAETKEEFVAAVRAFDRVLISGHYVIPLFHAPRLWVAHWAHLRLPAGKETTITNSGLDLDTWWSDIA